MKKILFTFLIFSACTAPDKLSLKVLRETGKMRHSPIVYSAQNNDKKTNDKLDIRKNNSFLFQSQTIGSQKTVIYAGTFQQIGDTLFLSFQEHHKDPSWTGKAIINVEKNEITFLSNNNTNNKTLHLTNKK